MVFDPNCLSLIITHQTSAVSSCAFRRLALEPAAISEALASDTRARAAIEEHAKTFVTHVA